MEAPSILIGRAVALPFAAETKDWGEKRREFERTYECVVVTRRFESCRAYRKALPLFEGGALVERKEWLERRPGQHLYLLLLLPPGDLGEPQFLSQFV